ncbi:MAG: DUF4197 domain-containing protein [Mariprofundales bacterium]
MGSLLGGEKPSSVTNHGASRATLGNGEMIAGLKDALQVGSTRVVRQLGAIDGFNSDPKVHIPLPDSLQKAKSLLSSFGMGGITDELELKLNRAAEAAAPKAKKIFGKAIREMRFTDARAILEGSKDAATRYFQRKMQDPLAKAMRPIVDRAMADVGAVQAYDQVIRRYRTLPMVPDLKANLTQHVIDGGLKGIFLYMATEEAAIRHDPLKRSTAILKKVFADR